MSTTGPTGSARTGPTPVGTCPLSHHIEFRGQLPDAEHALCHYLNLLEKTGIRTGLTEINDGEPNSYRAQVRMTVPGIGDLLLSLSAVTNPAYVEAFTYRANLTVLTPEQVNDQSQVRALFRELELLPLTDYELIADRMPSESIEDLAVWEIMPSDQVLRWLGGPLPENNKRLLVEQKLAGLLALRSQAHAGRLPETEAGQRLAEWLTNRYLSIRMVYQHIDLFLGLLDDDVSGS